MNILYNSYAHIREYQVLAPTYGANDISSYSFYSEPCEIRIQRLELFYNFNIMFNILTITKNFIMCQVLM